MKAITSPDEINLDHHAVIEASAGTGKTYTITHLVLRYILIQRLPVSRILLVTFTDKATSELKSRIQEEISRQLTDKEISSTDKELLNQALRDLHLASIHTIHGFCQRVMKEFAFEQGSVLDKSLVDDNTVFIKQLQALKRTWPAIEGIVEKLKKVGKSVQQLDGILIDLAKQVKPGDTFYPDTPERTLAKAEQLLQSFQTTDLNDIEADFKSLPGLSEQVLNNRWLNKLMFVVNQLNGIKKKRFEYDDLFEVLPELNKKVKEVINSTDIKKHPELKDLSGAPLFSAYFNQLKIVLGTLDAAVKAENYQFIIEMVHSLKARVKQHKVSLGQISYDDMITDLAEALSAEASSDEQLLTVRLRDKYQVALIDEFQDTDSQQWLIFKWLFTSSQETHRLVLIGDPKQSIYGFRGADVHTYEIAKSHLMDSQRKGLGYRLSTNFRSLPDLTQKLNQFFTYQSHDLPCWYVSEDVVVSSPTQSQRTDIGGPLLLVDNSELAALNSITVEGEGLLVDGLKHKFANQIARLIQQRLLGQVEFKRKSVEKTLDAGDVCVLVRNKKDAQPIEQALDRLNIPHSFYKKTDLYQSAAAIQIQLILTALAFPQMKKQVNNAWLSTFFNLNAEQIKHFNESQGVVKGDSILSNCLRLWLSIKDSAAQQNWTEVFYILFEETGTTERLYVAGRWRMLANLQQIKQELLSASLDQKLDAHGLLYQLLSSRSSQLISKEDWQQKETELPAVQIMTIHSSKGLEYPVVFLFGDFSAPTQNRQFCKYHDPSLSSQVFNLADANTQLYQTETEAEYKRLYYVAMTRAIFKLFVPVYESSTYHSNRTGLFYKDQVVDRLNKSGLAVLTPQLEQNSTPDTVMQSEAVNPPRPLVIPDIPAIGLSRTRMVHSFSSLQRQDSDSSTNFGEIAALEPVQADDVNQEVITSTQNKPTTENTSIPGGAQTGNVLHGIFENLNFKTAFDHKNVVDFQKDQSVTDVIKSQMDAFLMPDGELLNVQGKPYSTYSNEFAEWVWHTLNKPIDALGGLRLCELNDADRRHEMSFFWSHAGHVLTGFIDLLFKVKRPDGDEYYILDWKSNLSAGGYAPEVLSEEVMKAHHYHDQYRWYALAIKTWFNNLQLKNAKLAGALYLFSRGIDSDKGDQNGVFYQDLTVREYSVENLRSQLIDTIESATLKWPVQS